MFPIVNPAFNYFIITLVYALGNIHMLMFVSELLFCRLGYFFSFKHFEVRESQTW